MRYYYLRVLSITWVFEAIWHVLNSNTLWASNFEHDSYEPK